MAPELIFCADGNAEHARAALAAGWRYGVRLPARGMLRDVPLHFADQDWRRPDRARYFALLALHRPALATVLDWEEPHQLAEVLSWAEEAAPLVGRAVIVVPKVPGGVPDLPREIGGKEVRLGYSIPTSHGGAPLGLWELAGRTLHLLGGSPHGQLEVYSYLRGTADVRSLDGNMIKKQATSRCLFWGPSRGPKGHWRALDGHDGDGPLEALRRSLGAVRSAWTDAEGRELRPCD